MLATFFTGFILFIYLFIYLLYYYYLLLYIFRLLLKRHIPLFAKLRVVITFHIKHSVGTFWNLVTSDFLLLMA